VPFLQAVLDDFDLLPIAAGLAPTELVARALDAVWGGDDTLIVVSSDLSHYHTSDEARKLDATTTQSILERRSDLSDEQACGARGINGLMQVARHRGSASSSSTSATPATPRVTAPVSWAMAATRSSRLESGSRILLLETAAEAIESQLERRVAAGPAEAALPAELRELRASFVTLTVAGELRGCCGTLEARRALATTCGTTPAPAPSATRASRRSNPGVAARGPRGLGAFAARARPGAQRGRAARAAGAGRGRPRRCVARQSRHFPPQGLGAAARPGRVPRAPQAQGRLGAGLLAEDVEVWRYSTESAAAAGANRRP